MSKPPSHIGVHFLREWRIRRPFVYRYLEKQFVDQFFEDGSIRISSFSEFSKHRDEQRKDSSEGQGFAVHMNQEGTGQTIIAKIAQGADTYVLCGSTRYHVDLAEAFKTDSGFRINDPTAFANVIAHHLPGFRDGCEGSCIYMASRTVTRDMGPISMDALTVDGDQKRLDIGKSSQVISGILGDDLYFTKLLKYSNQNEYRILWNVHSKSQTFIDIRCPEAIQFCTQFSDLVDEVE